MPIVLPVALSLFGSRDSEIRMRPVVDALSRAGFLVPVADPSSPSVDAAADPADLIEQHRPGVVLVHGGSAAALVAATAASERGIPVAHLDAGHCDGDVTDTLPSEPVRRMLGRIAALQLAPTEHARRVLLASAVPEGRIVVTGDPLVDAVLSADTATVASEDRRVVLVVAHRPENRGAPMQRIGSAVRVLAARFPGHVFVLCSGPELAVHAGLTTAAGRAPNILSTPLPPFAGLVRLLADATLVLTDCGELEEVAPSLDVPVLVLAATTDRPEGVLAGTSHTVGTRVETIVAEASALLADPLRHVAMARRPTPFGDGRAADRIVAALSALLGRGERWPDFAPRVEMGLASR
ncbi:UDP-N-acetylglucosamine 2-epimerase [Cryocola sp. 340MFSha3.1]|uniref:UDP-N-acetylglucosamine 2-epimerase n=1 Tax=Cryocola sp. 340MFSha3.1 TaxID=1169145 RepID=UPI000377AF75|nr:UDP-N-acetylglucosamine 2-epimerase [Cryocola sp. 340MFSha3.1]